ncbi:zincin-like metallopeptidase domain-containing protein [Pseudomonas sp. CCC4.1]|uniref:zincin-like metallopeptidase domain-containing protein n=1 Tax=Pseudomonas TaxID=286 RepID=UPI00193B6C0F|nr:MULTISPECIES: zincin-like metallopeptidase domain-containing protein [Pseudomonas]MDY7572682.1 zincin-like metallopeptidase domain-containing protein [Pseudomonas sp. CCC4.1]MEB0143184.1 zincin-like metallopeptidase domain-containing protein [Pseudomonas sp. CCC4.1]
MTLSVDDAKALVIEFCATYPVASTISYKLRATQEELYGPQAAGEAVGGILGSFRPGSRQADFATSNFRNEDEFKETLRHEVLGHFGINTFNPAEKRAVLDGIIESRNEPGMSELWAEVAQLYPEADDSLKAEEVFAFACEAIEPQTRGNVIEGTRSFRETCIERSRPMQIRDLINVTTMVAEGMRDRSRSQQNFPESDHAQFKREQTMDAKKPFHEVVAEKLIEQLKQGTAPWQMPWKAGDGGGMMPFNPTTGKRYKGINAIHLLSQGRDDQRWLTFNQAKAAGAQVRKGEKSTSIQYWKFEEEQTKRDENNKPVLDGKGDPVKVRVRLERPKMFMANVFNAEQIDGLPLYQKPVQTWNALERAETILQASGADIRHGGDRAYYRPSTDNIQLPDKAQFPSADNYYATALHELGHWTGHGSRLDRDLSHPFGSEGYAKEELRAEIASMILGDELGIGHDPGQHVSYVQSWIKALQNDPLEIFRAASDAEKIQTFVLGLEQQQIQEQGQTQQPHRLQDEPDEQGASMQIPTQPERPNIQAEDWALRAIERADLDQVARRMTDDQLQVFDQVLAAMHPLANDNAFWARREEAMEAMFNDVDTVAEQIQRAQEIIADEQRRRVDVAKRDQVQESVNVAPEPMPLNPNEQMVATALRNVLSEPEPELKASFGRLLGVTSGQALGYELPGDWSGETQVVGIATDPDKEGVHMVEGDESPEFYGLYARDQEGKAVWLADYETQEEAQDQADRLAAINSHAQVEENAIDRLALSAKAEFTQERSETPQTASKPKATREYLAVPYGERAAAKAAGAAWDNAAKSWYVGPNGDTAALARWKPEFVRPALDLREEFADALRSVGLIVSGDHPIMDGKKHRVPVEGGKAGATDGFYVGHTDGHPAGSIINNKTQIEIKWKSKGYTLTDEQKAALHAEAANKLQAREASILKTHEAVAAKVTRSMESLVPVVELTPYMSAKGIQPLSGVLTDKAGKETVIPAIDENGKQWTAQYIQKDGTKRFAKDGRKEGCFHPLGGLDALAAAPVIVIAEGYATASTLASSLGHATVAAFDSGNLPAVAKALHAKFPDKPIVIAGDDDRHQVMTHGTNAGRTKAVEAAKAVGGKAIFPTFAPGEVVYPDTLPAITPQAYRKHTQAAGELKTLISQDGPSAGDPAQSERAAELKAEMLSDAQLAALDKMKRLTDFNDLATKSSLEREGLERQVNNAVAKVIEQHQVKVQQPIQERVQGIEEKQQTRRVISR